MAKEVRKQSSLSLAQRAAMIYSKRRRIERAEATVGHGGLREQQVGLGITVAVSLTTE